MPIIKRAAAFGARKRKVMRGNPRGVMHRSHSNALRGGKLHLLDFIISPETAIYSTQEQRLTISAHLLALLTTTQTDHHVPQLLT